MFPFLGLVENMSYFVCPECGKQHEIFGESRAERLAADFAIPHTARIPIDPKITAMVDTGEIEQVDGGCVSELVDSMEKELPLS